MPRLIALALLVALAACTRQVSATFDNAESGESRVRVAVTISTFASFVEAVGGDKVSVTTIVPVGASPETFQPTPQDVATVSNAQLLVENGAGLEGWLDRLLRDANNKDRKTVVCTDGLPVVDNNPHLWMDPAYAKHYVLAIRDGLSAVDPADKEFFARNARAYNAKLDALTAHIQAQIDAVPPERRFMVVFHNAWYYYNKRFGITTLGFVERNPGQEPNPQQIARLIDLAKEHHLSAVFSEPEYSPKILHAIAQGAGIKVVEDLYDDSVGTKPGVADYISMLVYDTNAIVRSMH